MSRILRSATAARSGAASPMPIRLPNCRPAWWRWTRPSSLADLPASDGSRPRISSPAFMRRSLSAQELLVAVELPVAPKNSAHFFCEFARRHGDYAIVGLAAQAIVENDMLPIFGLSSLPLAIGRYWPGPRRALSRQPSRRRCCRELGGLQRGARPAVDRRLPPRCAAPDKVVAARCVATLLGRPGLSMRGDLV